MSETIYGASDIAALFGVEKAAVSNWCRRHADTPTPDFETTDGRKYWLSLDAWSDWVATRNEVSRNRREAQVEKLRAKLAAAEAALNTPTNYEGGTP